MAYERGGKPTAGAFDPTMMVPLTGNATPGKIPTGANEKLEAVPIPI